MNRIDKVLHEAIQTSVDSGYASSLEDMLSLVGNNQIKIDSHPSPSGKPTINIIYLTTDRKPNGSVRFQVDARNQPTFSSHRGYFATQDGKQDLEQWKRKVWR